MVCLSPTFSSSPVGKHLQIHFWLCLTRPGGRFTSFGASSQTISQPLGDAAGSVPISVPVPVPVLISVPIHVLVPITIPFPFPFPIPHSPSPPSSHPHAHPHPHPHPLPHPHLIPIPIPIPTPSLSPSHKIQLIAIEREVLISSLLLITN